VSIHLRIKLRPAIRYAQQLQRLDPLYEPAYVHLMRRHAQMGDRASALRVYHQCITTLQAELGVNSSPVTCKLYEELLILDRVPSPPTCTANVPSSVVNLSNLVPEAPKRQVVPDHRTPINWSRERMGYDSTAVTCR